jgi:hypothetical protein
MHKNPYEKGRLVISFDIKFPESSEVDIANLTKLEALLPKRPKIELPKAGDYEEHKLVDMDPGYERSKRQGSYGEDDEMQGGAQRVQCANQ